MAIEPALKALADTSRLRVMRLIAHLELSVGELAQVLGQSQPRVSQHVAKLADAMLVERQREGTSVYLRPATCGGTQGPVVRAIESLLETAERNDAAFAAQCATDRARLAAIREAREREAQVYFSRHAEDWDQLREHHGSEDAVEVALIAALGSEPVGRLLDIGTGTGRIAEMLAPRAERVVALDKSLDMLRVARARLQGLGPNRIELVQGDFTALSFDDALFDTVLFHQVLHFAADPAAALTEAARVTAVGGRIAVVDLATHQHEVLRAKHAHLRLGFADAAMARMMRKAGFTPAAPVAVPGRDLTVKIWLGQRITQPVALSRHAKENA